MEINDTLILLSLTQTEINAVTSPTIGGTVYNSTTNKAQTYNGTTWDDLGGGGVEQPLAFFGAKSDGYGKMLVVNGKSSDSDQYSTYRTRSPVFISGDIIGLAYYTKEANTTTKMKLHINGVVVQTIYLVSINSNKTGREDFTAQSVSPGDFVEIEWDGGQKPSECIMILIIQPT